MINTQLAPSPAFGTMNPNELKAQVGQVIKADTHNMNRGEEKLFHLKSLSSDGTYTTGTLYKPDGRGGWEANTNPNLYQQDLMKGYSLVTSQENNRLKQELNITA